ncbi:MAG: hypothetical protein IIC67_03190 [Thaumarchaeota archaeon]|nr:hypothetical protein [Nitrososphaerota archaeon]
MDHCQVLTEILNIEPTVRFVGMYDCNFKIITDGYQPGVIPHVSREEHQNSIRYDIRRWETYRMFQNQLGDTEYAMVKYNKVTLLTFSLSDGEFLRVAIEPDADYKMLIDKIQDIIIKNQA